MDTSVRYDVVVIGAGPGGALAARRCAENGLHTLLVEKRKLPRDKVCSGMVMGRWAQEILIENFGPIPDEVLVPPQSLLGYAVHVSGTEIQFLDVETPITWRKHLDNWMTNRARDAGAEVWEETRLIGASQIEKRYSVRLAKGDGILDVECTFLVGADGARSALRAALFPELKPTYWHCYRECYNIALDLPPRRFNFFSSVQTAPFYFCTHDKDGYMLMEGGAQIGRIKQTAGESRDYLIKHHGMDASQKPVWRDGCVEPILYGELFSGSFRPARANAMLVGDAAGLNMPVTGEGVGTSMKTGAEAANAIIQSVKGNQPVDAVYMKTIEDIIGRFKDTYQFSRRIKAAAAGGDPKALSDALLESWDHALRLF